MPRFEFEDDEGDKDENNNDGAFIDIFDCESEEFWLREAPLDRSDEGYKCTLRLTDSKDVAGYKRVAFSENNRFACVQCEKKMMIFDLSTAKEDSSINNEDEGVVKLCESIRERTIFGSTYNSFMGIHLGSDETAEDTDDYWVVMNSQSYGKMHFLKLRDLPEQKNESQVNVKTMGGKFIKAQEQALVKVMDTYDPEFWEDTTVIFSRDGKKAFIDTPDQLLTVNMDKQSPQYLEHSSVPHLQYDGVNMFARNDSQMFFCVRDEVKDKSTIKFLSEET